MPCRTKEWWLPAVIGIGSLSGGIVGVIHVGGGTSPTGPFRHSSESRSASGASAGNYYATGLAKHPRQGDQPQAFQEAKTSQTARLFG